MRVRDTMPFLNKKTGQRVTKDVILQLYWFGLVEDGAWMNREHFSQKFYIAKLW